jgi:hypothetical protein
MSHHEENYDSRMFEMEKHLYRVLYTSAFKDAFVGFLGKIPDYTRFRLWYGPIESYWLKSGKAKKYVTLVLTYDDKTLIYEQDSLESPEGCFQYLK